MQKYKYKWKHVILSVLVSQKINKTCKNYFEIEKLEFFFFKVLILLMSAIKGQVGT